MKSLIFISALALTSEVLFAGPLFEDGFEGGDHTYKSNSIYWTGGGADRVNSKNPLDGRYAMEFVFRGKPEGKDAMAEQRLNLGRPYKELWVKYDLYIPENYFHRPDFPANNKFFAAFNNNYQPGFQVNFSTHPTGSGGSNILVHYYRLGKEQGNRNLPHAKFISKDDLGGWHRIVMHLKVPSSLESKDGVMRIWKNGGALIDIADLASNGTEGLNYIDEVYFFGWANSGFNEDTSFFIDNVIVDDKPISVWPKSMERPDPPRLLLDSSH